jgi:hypothetical protein
MDIFSSPLRSGGAPVPMPAMGCRYTTALSRVTALGGAFGGPARALARTSLVLGVLAMSTTGCLITSTPQFTPDQHTRPFLDVDSAVPNTREVVKVDTVDLLLHPHTPMTFSANFISQDDAAGGPSPFQKVASRLYIDYGTTAADQQQPFVWVAFGTDVNPGTLDQTNRRVQADWYPETDIVSPGCHTVTLIASHLFDTPTQCPVCGDDFSTVTWLVNRCDTSTGSCDDLPVPCPTITTSCVQAQRDNPEATACPEAVDGGVQ